MPVPATARHFLEWLNRNSPAVQSAATAILVVLTGYYAVITHRLLKQARQSAEAAKAQAEAAQRQADVAENTIAFMKQQHDEQLGQGPQVVREEIARAKGLIESWRSEARSQSFVTPDPDLLSKTTLREALPHARRISTKLADLLVEVENALLDAHTEMKKFREAARHQFHSGMTFAAGRASKRLDTAMALLQEAEKLLPNPPADAPHTKLDPPAPAL